MSTEQFFCSFKTAAEKSEDKLQRVKIHEKHLNLVHFSNSRWGRNGQKAFRAKKKNPNYSIHLKIDLFCLKGISWGKKKLLENISRMSISLADCSPEPWERAVISTLSPEQDRGGVGKRNILPPSPGPTVLTLASGQIWFCNLYIRIRSEIFLKLLLHGPFSSFFPSFCGMEIKQSKSYWGFSAFTAS